MSQSQSSPDPVPTPDHADRQAFEIPWAVSPRAVPADASLDHPHLLFNGELAWIDFNWRVLSRATLESVPLLERVRFLAIAADNLDRFVRTRLGGLQRQDAAGIIRLSPEGRSAEEQIRLIQDAISAMQDRMTAVWRDELEPRLAATGVEIVAYAGLTETERERVDHIYHTLLYPVLTPLAVDSGHPFPFISNQSLSLAVMTRHPDRRGERFARVKIPQSRSRWIRAGDGYRFLPVEALIAEHAGTMFRGLRIQGAFQFRVTRSAESARDEEDAADLVQAMSDELRERRFAPVVRLEVEDAMPEEVLAFLARELGIAPSRVTRVAGPLGLADLASLAELDIPEHRHSSWEPQVPAALAPRKRGERDIFSVLREGDILIHHPYESFQASVQRFVEAAADDPAVVAVKQTLYRTGEDSPVVRALVRAADAGKQVAALVEITASFDEQSNIDWAEKLESHGVHVTHGLAGLKTHAKVTLVVRAEGDELRMYGHIGTGNYHARTARLYTDLGLLTADPAIGRDLVDLFHQITSDSPGHDYEQLIVAPGMMRERFEQLIEREIAHAEAGLESGIVAKLNALDDVRIIRQLYRASQAGVPTNLVVRGQCTLRPGHPGFSENIRVSSIVGRFLEHDRIYRFENDGSPELFMGSADWRRRNLEERVEVIVPVTDADAKNRLDRVLDAALSDNMTAWDLHADGSYTLRRPGTDEEPRALQEVLMASVRPSGRPLRL